MCLWCHLCFALVFARELVSEAHSAHYTNRACLKQHKNTPRYRNESTSLVQL